MAGDNERFEDLYRRYHRRLVYFFTRFGFSRDEARDLAHDTFLRVFEYMKQYRGDAEWAYIAKVARTVALNTIRGKTTIKRHAILVSDDALDELAGDAPSPNDLATAKDTRLRLYQAVDSLPYSVRICVLLYLFEFSYNDIQKILAISEDAVKSRLREARHRLRQALNEEPTGIEWPHD